MFKYQITDQTAEGEWEEKRSPTLQLLFSVWLYFFFCFLSVKLKHKKTPLTFSLKTPVYFSPELNVSNAQILNLKYITVYQI